MEANCECVAQVKKMNSIYCCTLDSVVQCDRAWMELHKERQDREEVRNNKALAMDGTDCTAIDRVPPAEVVQVSLRPLIYMDFAGPVVQA